MTYLDRLIEAAPVGQSSRGSLIADVAGKYGWSVDVCRNVFLAENGSLDAALSLHIALLPLDNLYSIEVDPTRVWVKVFAWPNGRGDEKCRVYAEGWSKDNISRAWLLAILNAYRSLQ